MCAYDEHQELVNIPTKSWSEYTMTQQARAGRNIQPMTNSEKLIMYVWAFCNQGKPGTCVQVNLCLCTCKQEKLCTNAGFS